MKVVIDVDLRRLSGSMLSHAFCDGKLYVHVVGNLVLFTAANDVKKSVKIYIR